jgi:hypothetical protein
MLRGSLHSTALTAAETSGLIDLTTHLAGTRLEQNGKNGGCAIPHNLEAKALGIKMGDPEFKIRDLIKRENVRIFSSNYAL